MDPLNNKNDTEKVERAPNGSQPSSRTASVRHENNEKAGEHEFFNNTQETPAKGYDKVRNPLAGIPKARLMRDVEAFAQEKDMMDSLPELQKGALIAQDPARFEMVEELSEEEKDVFRQETSHRWRQPRTLYYMTSEHFPTAPSTTLTK